VKTYELLDRLELLYPTNTNLADLRRAYIDKDLSSIFRLLPEEHEELRKAVIEQNLHSIFRLLPEEHEELRKAVIEQNLHSIFRLVDLRRAYIDKDLSSIFRLLPEEHEELRKAVLEQNLHSIFRLVDDEELRKLLLEDNIWKLWPILSRYVDTQFVEAFKNFFVNDTEIWDDCFARGQLESKLWLVRELQQCDIPLGTVFICAGWYATIATMLFESDMEVDKIRSFDMDESCVEIAEVFNKPWFVDKWRFKSITQNIMDINYNEHTWKYWSNDNKRMSHPITDIPDTVINTSCEHIDNFEAWYSKIPDGKLVILQSNNFYEVDEHVNCVADVDEFIDTAPMTTVLYSGELELPKYNRFMIIGYK
jgi:hypothetical protein